MNARLATKSDLPDLVRLNDQIQFQHANQYPDEFRYPTDYDNVSDFFEKLIDGETNVVIVATNNSGVIGYLYYEIRRISENTFLFDKKRYYIHHIVIDKAVRRSGAASALFAWVENAAKADGATQIALNTWELNHEAHKFFKSKNFEISQLVFTKYLS